MLEVHVLDLHNLRATLLRHVPQIVGNLHAQPRLSGATQRGGQPDRKLGTDGGMPIHHARQSAAGDSQALGKLGDGQTPISICYYAI